MKKVLKITMAIGGFALATIASTSKVKASSGNDQQSISPTEGCYDSGDCGTTPGGTKLNGTYQVLN